MHTGFARDADVRSAHNMAACIGGIRAFCCRVVPHMAALQQEGFTPAELFNVAAKYEIVRPGGGLADLQTIVEEIVASDDGYPSFDSALQPLVDEIMQDYNNARTAALAGADALGTYRTQEMVPHIMDTAGSAPASDLKASDVPRVLQAWCNYTPERPFEKIVHNFISQSCLE